MTSRKTFTKTKKQWNSSPRIDKSVMDSEDTGDHLMTFWYSLPRTKHLRAEGIDQLNLRKSSNYLMQTISEIVDITNHAEQVELDRLQSAQDQKVRRSALLDGSRFADSTYSTKPPLNETLGNYLHSMPRAWAVERKELEDDLKERVLRRMESYKPRPPTKLRPIRIPPTTINNSSSGFRQRMLSQVDMIQDEALRQKISTQRRKEIKDEMNDMDLFSRPTHFLKVPLMEKADPLEGTDSVGIMYKKVMDKVSQEALHKLRNPEVQSEDHTIFMDKINKIKETSSFRTSTRLASSKDESFDNPNYHENSNRQTDINEPSTETEFGLSHLDPNSNTRFELDCLKEIVKFQEESGWNPKEAAVLSTPRPSDTPPSVALALISGRKSNASTASGATLDRKSNASAGLATTSGRKSNASAGLAIASGRKPNLSTPSLSSSSSSYIDIDSDDTENACD